MPLHASPVQNAGSGMRFDCTGLAGRMDLSSEFPPLLRAQFLSKFGFVFAPQGPSEVPGERTGVSVTEKSGEGIISPWRCSQRVAGQHLNTAPQLRWRVCIC